MRLGIFYSWQTDLPDATNRGCIRKSLTRARTALQRDREDIEIHIDEATRNRPGSPDISETIREKIRAADAFVCDVTFVNAGGTTPNPNVLF